MVLVDKVIFSEANVKKKLLQYFKHSLWKCRGKFMFSGE